MPSQSTSGGTIDTMADGERVIAVIKRLQEEIWNGQSPLALSEIVSQNFVDHRLDWEEGLQLVGEEGGSGYASFEARIRKLRTVFQDFRVITDDLFAAGDRAVWLWTMVGTYAGGLLHPDLPGTGRAVSIKGISIYRVRNGMVVERWVSQDIRGLERQVTH